MNVNLLLSQQLLTQFRCVLIVSFLCLSQTCQNKDQQTDNADTKAIGAGTVSDFGCDLELRDYNLSLSQDVDVGMLGLSLFEVEEKESPAGSRAFYLAYRIPGFDPEYLKMTFPPALARKMAQEKEGLFCARFQIQPSAIRQAENRSLSDPDDENAKTFYGFTRYFHYIFCGRYENGFLVETEVNGPADMMTAVLQDTVSSAGQTAGDRLVIKALTAMEDELYLKELDVDIALKQLVVAEMRDLTDKNGNRTHTEEAIKNEIYRLYADRRIAEIILYPYRQRQRDEQLLPRFIVTNLAHVYGTTERAAQAFRYAFATMYVGEYDKRSGLSELSTDESATGEPGCLPDANGLTDKICGEKDEFLMLRHYLCDQRSTQHEGHDYNCESPAEGLITSNSDTPVVCAIDGSPQAPLVAINPLQQLRDAFQRIDSLRADAKKTPGPQLKAALVAANGCKKKETKDAVLGVNIDGSGIRIATQSGENLLGAIRDNLPRFDYLFDDPVKAGARYRSCKLYLGGQEVDDEMTRSEIAATKPYWLGASEVGRVGTERFHTYRFNPGRVGSVETP